MIASRNAETSLDAQLRAAQAQLNQATTAANLAAKDEARYRALLEAGAVSVQTYDTYKSQLDNALAAEDAARAAVDAANADLLKNDQNLAAQRAAQEQAAALQSQLDAVNVNIDETEIRAHFDGIITQKYVEEGQLISSAIPIFALQNHLDNWIDFKVDETAINKFSIGQSLKVRGRDGSTVIDGTVESIRRKADFATQKATSERGDVDVIAFNVKVRTNSDAVWSGMRFSLDGVR
ncbi:MAG: HlyD family efflux transporter periplasmic adaptor subunit [Selenomonadaceae bacterium]|nr:HlyD family efflux transporter periplasmic adaptor subunit [Selenomonadaceae bacterium]